MTETLLLPKFGHVQERPLLRTGIVCRESRKRTEPDAPEQRRARHRRAHGRRKADRSAEHERIWRAPPTRRDAPYHGTRAT